MLMSRTVVLKLIANNLGITSGSFNNHKNCGITSECQAQLQMKSYQSAAHKKPWVIPWDGHFFPHSTTRQSSLFWAKPPGVVRAGLWALHLWGELPSRAILAKLHASAPGNGLLDEVREGVLVQFKSANTKPVTKLWWHFSLVIGL